MLKNENGAIIVETIFSWLFFTFLVLSIITLINITTKQIRIHYAITQTANELAMYSHILYATGLSGHIMSAAGAGETVQGQIDNVLDMGNLDTVFDAIGPFSETVGEVLEDPRQALRNLVAFGLDAAGNYIAQELLMRPRIERHLTGSGINVSDLNISDSIFIDSSGNIIIVAEYSVPMPFSGLIPFPAEITIRKTAKTRAWLGGSS